MKNYTKPELEKVEFATEIVAADLETGSGDVVEGDDE
jgi:hypothetical protein